MPDDVYTLWWRADRTRPWEAVYVGTSSRDCTDHLGVRRNGDFYTRRGTGRPSNRSLCWEPRRQPTKGK